MKGNLILKKTEILEREALYNWKFQMSEIKPSYN